MKLTHHCFHVCAFLGCSHIAAASGPQPANETEIGYCLTQTVSYWWFDLPLNSCQMADKKSVSIEARARSRASMQSVATRAQVGITREAARAQVSITHAATREQVSTTHAATRARVHEQGCERASKVQQNERKEASHMKQHERKQASRMQQRERK